MSEKQTADPPGALVAPQEFPVDLTTEEVAAVCDGRKTQLRIPLDPQPDPYYPDFHLLPVTVGFGLFGTDGPHRETGFGNLHLFPGRGKPSPRYGNGHARMELYGAANLRERRGMAWQSPYDTRERWDSPLGPIGSPIRVREPWWSDRREPGVAIYDATPEWGVYRSPGNAPVRASHLDGSTTTREESRAAMLPKFWSIQPASTMPDWATRLTLRVTGVSVERIWSADHPGIIAEGISDLPFDPEFSRNPYRYGRDKLLFEQTWNRKHGRSFPFDSNPWAWVYTFRVTPATEPTST